MNKVVADYYASCLVHHGVKGQKWGVQNGPPYPLDDSDKSETNGKIKRLSESESLDDTISKTNPKYRSKEMANNCVSCAIAANLRQRGYDVTATSTGGKGQDVERVLKKCFNKPEIVWKRGREMNTIKKASAELCSRFGDNASGTIGIDFALGGGHEFNWMIKNGNVTFFNPQIPNPKLTKLYIKRIFKHIDPVGNVDITRLDNVEINFDELEKYVKIN